MKTVKEWAQIYEDSDMDLADLISAIQADALRHAAEICRTVVLCNECASLCEAEAERLSKP